MDSVISLIQVVVAVLLVLVILVQQKGSGKNFIQSDFKPEHLRLVYNLFNNDIVKHYFEGKIKSKKPHLIRQF